MITYNHSHDASSAVDAGQVLSHLARDKCPPGGIHLGGDALLVHVPYCAATKRRVFVSFCISLAPAAAASANPLGFMDSLWASLPGQRTRFTFWEFDQVCMTHRSMRNQEWIRNVIF